MKGSSYEMVDFAVEANHVAAGRKRVKNWLLDTTVGEIRSPTRFAIKSFDDTNFVKFAMKGMDEECSNGNEGNSDTSCEPFSPSNRGERIVINVGGSRHETYIGTLHSVPDTRLYWITEKHVLSPEYDQEKQEYFFDRHPALFSYILDYYRTGKLHCPAEICGPLFEEELLFWGIDEAVIEPCCWMNYQKHRNAEVNLHSFDSLDLDEEKDSVHRSDIEHGNQCGDQNGDNNERETVNIIVRKWTHWQPKIWATLEEPNSSRAAQIIGLISMSLIVLSVTTFCLETLHVFSDPNSVQHKILGYIEMLCVLWFTLEFFTRLVFSTDKLTFFKSPMNWIDFCAICPFFLEMILRKNNMKTIVVLRVVRITRLFRIFKLSRHSYGLQILGHTLKSSCRELFLLVFFLSIAVIIFSSLIYYAEKDFQGDKFDSIPGSFWWSVVTMTTIGYGDIVPKTVAGKCVGIMCALCGVLVIALPIPVIVNNFSLYYSHAQARLRVSGKKKKPLLFGAANALRMTDPWASQRLLQKQRSRESEFSAIPPSPRRTPLASPTPSQRIFTGGQWERKSGQRPVFSRTSPCPSNNSSLNSRNSAKTPPISRKASNNNEDALLSKQTSPNRGKPVLLPVIRLSPNYESPSINVSPPSTPSKTNSQIQSSLGTPFPLSPCAESSVYSTDGMCTSRTSTYLSQQDSSPLQSPLFLCSPRKSTLSTCVSDMITVPSTPFSCSSASSKIASPRGRMGRRNGICALGYQYKVPQKRRPPATRVRKLSSRSSQIYIDNSDSVLSSRRDSRAISVFGDREDKSCLSAPSPGVSKTLFEVSRRLETMMPEEVEEQRISGTRRTTVVSVDSAKSQFSSRSSSPLVRQCATNTLNDSSSSQDTEPPIERLDVMQSIDDKEASIPILESVINGLIFKRRQQRQDNLTSPQILSRSPSQTIEQPDDNQNQDGLNPDENIGLTVGLSLGLASDQALELAPDLNMGLSVARNSDRKSTCSTPKILKKNFFGPRSMLLLSPKSKSLDDVRKKMKSKGKTREAASVCNSPGRTTPTSARFQYTISRPRDSGGSGTDVNTAQTPNYSPVDETIEERKDLKRGDSELTATHAFKCWKDRLTWTGRSRTYQNSTADKKIVPPKISRQTMSAGSSPMVVRKLAFVRSPWASRFGPVHDSGVDSMSMSQTQDTSTLDLPMNAISERHARSLHSEATPEVEEAQDEQSKQ